MKALEIEHDPERPVIEAIRRGDADALAELVSRQGRWVRAVIFAGLGRADEVEDVAQKVWMRVWSEARRLEDPSRWRPWLYRIARNAASDAARGRTRRRRLLGAWHRRFAGEVSDGHRVGQATPLHQLVADEGRRAVLQAIASLPELYREPFVLKHLEGWSYRQIGELLGLPPDTVETRLVRARRQLRERLAGKV